MRITNKGRRAVAAMIDVALHQRSRPVALIEISRRQRISVSFLEQLFGDLRRHGLVTSTRGAGGGYRIARRTQTITVADVIFAVDRPDAKLGNTHDGPMTSDGQRCLALELWTSLDQHVVEFLDSVQLQQLIDDEIGSGMRLAIASCQRHAARHLAGIKPRARQHSDGQ